MLPSSPDAQMQIVMPRETQPLPILFILYGLYLMSLSDGLNVCRLFVHHKFTVGTASAGLAELGSDQVIFYLFRDVQQS
jgi:hypothetical protein